METSNMPDRYDRLMGSLDGLPDVVATEPSTLRHMTPLLGTAELYIVQSYRQRDTGDTIFLECHTSDAHVRLALPNIVAECIARQRDRLSSKSRRRAAKASAQARKAAGIPPAFLKKRKGAK